jgi:cytoskeletal protein RodZ
VIRDRSTLSSDGFDSRQDDFRGADRWEPDNDEAPPLDTSPDGHDSAWQTYPSQPHPGRRVRKFIPEGDETNFAKVPSPERRRSPVLTAILFLVLVTLIGSGAAALWFYYGPALSATTTSEVDKTAEALSRLADEQRKLAQTVSALEQSVQDSFQKNAMAREQDIQRFSAQAQALQGDLDGLRAAIANTTTRSPIAHPPKNAAVQSQKKGSDRKSAQAPQAEPSSTTPSPEH